MLVIEMKINLSGGISFYMTRRKENIMSDTSENLKLYSVKDMVAFLRATYNFFIGISYFCILDKFQNIEDIFLVRMDLLNKIQ